MASEVEEAVQEMVCECDQLPEGKKCKYCQQAEYIEDEREERRSRR